MFSPDVSLHFPGETCVGAGLQDEAEDARGKANLLIGQWQILMLLQASIGAGPFPAAMCRDHARILCAWMAGKLS